MKADEKRRKGLDYMRSPGRVEHDSVAVGEGLGRIVEVREERVRFVDEKGRQREVGLSRYLDRRPCYVGSRALDGGWSSSKEPPFWVMIAGDKRFVQFAFDTYEAAYLYLLIPLSEYGYRTFDTT